MPNRRKHQQEVGVFLEEHLSLRNCDFSLPRGTGMESYFIEGNQQEYFVKVGVPVDRYLIMAEIGLTPPILAHGNLESGLSIIVQPFIKGRKPSQRDYWNHLEQVAGLVQKMHTHPQVKQILPTASSNLHKEAGLQALDQLRQKWERYRAQVPNVAAFVGDALKYLEEQIKLFSTQGLVASHGDICNANWLFAADGEIYLIDFESMSLDDPALDLGALLWWYYPPELRQRFLDIAGYHDDPEIKSRMQVRMSMHCLNITLPRPSSFDRFNPDHYEEMLADFCASLHGEENPQGYAG